ncbi:MAG: phosphomannomutase/phosphoglucomutase [Planctomycetes bacterium]|nr:phosphomannomutase/phosphoglucomutase [Planctomycetota bacterium]
MNRAIFRTYDIRGLADTELTDEVVEGIGASFGAYLGGKGKVAVGGDHRLSTPRVKRAFQAGLARAGLDSLDVGSVTTPMVYFAAHRYAAELVGAAAVTASHNPPEYNGLKLMKGTAALHGEEIAALADGCAGAPRAARPGRTVSRDIQEEYLADLANRVRLARPLKVVVDAGNGSAGPVAPVIYRRLGCEVTPLYCEPDGRFPNHPADPTRLDAVQELTRKVLELRADLGIGFDGDGDRIGVVDDRGRVAWGDQLMALFYREILARRPGAPCLIEVKCSQALVEEVERLGGKPLFTKTGHSLIKARMKELSAPFAGEMSGHMFFADEFPGYDDAIYAGARLLRLVAAGREPLSALVDRIPKYHATPELRVGCPDAEKFRVVEAFVATARAEHEILDVDGARVLFGDGWGLVRASNTGPHLILRAEGRSPEIRDRILAYLRDRLSRHAQVDLSQVDRELGLDPGQA